MTQSFEEAYKRLETILQKMNEQGVSLDDSLALYEEADKLISSCQKRLLDAETKIEILMKNRQGNVTFDESNTPETRAFNPTT